MVRVAINGFGRIGRQVLQAGINDPEIEWIAVNDLTDTHTLAHLLKYDSVYGKFPGTIEALDSILKVNNKEIKVVRETDPTKLPWKDLKIDIVVESTGRFTKAEEARAHIKAGAKKVVISAPAKGNDITIVKGVNEHLLQSNHTIISNASCTTNCLAPMVKVLNDNFGVEKGFMVTAHSYTADQRLVDGPHSDLRRARAAAQSIVPTTTGAARAVAEVIPELKGKLNGFAIRVPVICGSIVTFTASLKKSTTREDINKLFKSVSEHELKNIIEYTEEPLVSRDILRNSHSCIFDALSTDLIEGNFVSVSGWYDNEWGYSNRMVDIIKIIARKM
ncbi:MAG: type I glyceraldehyde-3-phosphate dehydrogenase [Candidatus Woesearchaeota archaeon]